MAISYNNLWKQLIDKGIIPAELRKETKISDNTMTKLHKNESVTVDTPERICTCLDCDFSDIIAYVREQEKLRSFFV